MNNLSTTRDAAFEAIEKLGEIHGTEALARHLNVHRKSWLIKCVRVIERNGLITIVPSSGGRGNQTVYKRNRNSAGQARKKKP